MKKVVCLIAAVMLCISLASVAFADTEFVPSISYKGAPEIVAFSDDQGNPAVATIIDENGDVVGYVLEDCIVLTPLAEAESSTQIPDDAEETLLSVYEKMKNGTMKLPYGDDVDADNMVVKDLFDISWLCEDHPAIVAEEGVSVVVTLDVGVPANTDVSVMTYVDGAWSEINSVKNNGDGTITCVFEEFGAVAISVPTPGSDIPDKTGDESNVMLWALLLAVSATAVVVMVILRRRDFAK